MKRIDHILRDAGLGFWNEYSTAIGVWRVSVYDTSVARRVLESHGYTVRSPYGSDLVVTR